MATSDVYIANQALAAVPAPAIESLNEQSLEAKEVKRAYRPVIDEMLEGFAWDFASKRITLAAVVNDRATEWGYAYALPAGLVPARISWVSGAGANAYVPLVGQTLAATNLFADGDAGYGYTVVGSTIYTNAPGAVLDARDTSISEAAFPPLFTRAVVLELAKRIVLPITKNGTRYRELTAEAKVAWETAAAANLNRSPQGYMTRLPDTLAARY